MMVFILVISTCTACSSTVTGSYSSIQQDPSLSPQMTTDNNNSISVLSENSKSDTLIITDSPVDDEGPLIPDSDRSNIVEERVNPKVEQSPTLVDSENHIVSSEDDLIMTPAPDVATQSPSEEIVHIPVTLTHEHIWSDWSIIESPTFSAEGSQERICTDCGESESQAVSKEVLDTAAITAYGNSYAVSLGFTLDASVASGNAGYYPALDYCVNTMSECYSYVAAQVYNTYSRLMNAHGTIEGARYYCTVQYLGSDAYGTYILISDYYG